MPFLRKSGQLVRKFPEFYGIRIFFRITGFSDFVRRLVFQKLENITFRKLDLFQSSGEEGGHLLCWVP
jgi:hypothetical protein